MALSSCVSQAPTSPPSGPPAAWQMRSPRSPVPSPPLVSLSVTWVHVLPYLPQVCCDFNERSKGPRKPSGGAQGADSDLPGPGWRLRDWWVMKGVALALLKEGVGDSAFTLPAPRAPAVCTAGRTVPWPGGREALVQQGQRGHSGAGDKGKGESGVAGAEQGAPPAFTASPAGYLLPSGVQHHRVIKPEETASPAVSLSFSGPRLGTGGVDSPKVMGLFHKAQGPRPVVTLPCVLGGCTSRLHPLSRGRTPRVPALPGWVNFGKYLPLSGPQFPQQ